MKRIICSILVVVMLALSFASCGYNVADDDMTDYTKFSDTEIKAFEKALEKIIIENGDFTTDDPTREDAVWEVIYEAVADAMDVTADDKKTTGKPDGRDIIYYCYYMTAEFDGKKAYFYTSKLDSSSPVSIQLLDGGDFGDDTLSRKIAELFQAYDFADGVYSSYTKTTDVTQKGDKVCVTYTKKVGDKEPVVYTNQLIDILAKPEGDKKAESFASYLCGQKFGTNLAEYTETDSDGNKVSYTNIKINWAINRSTVGTTAEGDTAYVTYTKKVGDDGKAEIVNELITVAKAPEGAATSIAELVANCKIGSKLVKDDKNKTEITLELTEDGKKVVYSAITVNWIHNEGEPIDVVKDAPFDEKTLVKDVEGVERDLEGRDISYYIYPVYFVNVPEFDAEFLVEKIILDSLASSTSTSGITQEQLIERAVNSLVSILYADEYSKLSYDEKATSEDLQDLLEDLVARADEKYIGKYTKKDADGKEISEDVDFSEAVALIVAYYHDIKVAEEGKTNASDELIKAKEDYDNAVNALDDAKKEENPDQDKIKELEDALKEADEALNGENGAEEANKQAEARYKEVEEDKAKNIKFLLGLTADKVALSTSFFNGYKIQTYNRLQAAYNREIKNNLAKEIYFFITENVKMNADGDLPSELVDDAYTKLYESYENEFYTGTDTESGNSNYKTHGSFKKFLVAKVNGDEEIKKAIAKDAKTFSDAKDILREYAEYITVPVVQVFRFADAYDLTISDSDYEDYKDEIENYYYEAFLGSLNSNFDVEEIYGVNSLKMAAQLDKILDHFLAYDEKSTSVDIYTKIVYEYTCEKLGEISFDGTPASKADTKTEK